MPIWGLRTVAQVIAAGFDGPQHCDEPWPYQFTVCIYVFFHNKPKRSLSFLLQPGQQVLVHVRGEGRMSVWLSARVIQSTYTKKYPVGGVLHHTQISRLNWLLKCRLRHFSTGASNTRKMVPINMVNTHPKMVT